VSRPASIDAPIHESARLSSGLLALVFDQINDDESVVGLVVLRVGSFSFSFSGHPPPFQGSFFFLNRFFWVDFVPAHSVVVGILLFDE